MRRIVLAFLVACTPARSFEPPTSFNLSAQIELVEAADDWNVRTFPDHRITWEENGRWRVLSQVPHGGYNGFCYHDERLIFITPDPPKGVTVYSIALHEFGHALGLKHTARGVMNPTVPTTTFADEDINECRRVEACP